jgi:hypothetical protein
MVRMINEVNVAAGFVLRADADESERIAHRAEVGAWTAPTDAASQAASRTP